MTRAWGNLEILTALRGVKHPFECDVILRSVWLLSAATEYPQGLRPQRGPGSETETFAAHRLISGLLTQIWLKIAEIKPFGDVY